MLIGAHSIIYSKNANADRAFFRDVLQLAHVDAGDGWLIFTLPPAEIAVHPADFNDSQELYLMVQDIERFVGQMREHKIACTQVEAHDWGLVTRMTLPGGGRIGVYQPRHRRPKPMGRRRTSEKRTLEMRSRHRKRRKTPSVRTRG